MKMQLEFAEKCRRTLSILIMDISLKTDKYFTLVAGLAPRGGAHVFLVAPPTTIEALNVDVCNGSKKLPLTY